MVALGTSAVAASSAAKGIDGDLGTMTIGCQVIGGVEESTATGLVLKQSLDRRVRVETIQPVVRQESDSFARWTDGA